MRIAILEDDRDQMVLLSAWLREAGHDCYPFYSGSALLKAVHHESFDLFVIDWGLPDIPGDQVLVALRERLGWEVLVLFVTVRDQEADIVRALQMGADDYMSKPLKKAETLARVDALKRRVDAPRQQDVFKFEPYRVDADKRCVTRDGDPIQLTEKEFDLVLFFARNTGRLLSRGHILESVWGRSADVNTRTVDTHVSRVRSKLGLTATDSNWRLISVYQHGYRLERSVTEGVAGA